VEKEKPFKLQIKGYLERGTYYSRVNTRL